MTIPQVVHQLWGGSPLPDHLAGYVDSWRAHHPGWRHRMWRDDELGWIPNRDLYDRAAHLVPDDAVWQFRADVARYAILQRYGGVWADCDAEALAPIDPLLAGHDAWAAAEDRMWVGNTILASTAGHPVIRALVDGLPDNIDARAPDRPTRLSGPQYLTPIWREHGCHIAATELVYPYSWRDVRRGTVPAGYGDAVVAHHWEHTRQLHTVGVHAGKARR